MMSKIYPIVEDCSESLFSDMNFNNNQLYNDNKSISGDVLSHQEEVISDFDSINVQNAPTSTARTSL